MESNCFVRCDHIFRPKNTINLATLADSATLHVVFPLGPSVALRELVEIQSWLSIFVFYSDFISWKYSSLLLKVSGEPSVLCWVLQAWVSRSKLQSFVALQPVGPVPVHEQQRWWVGRTIRATMPGVGHHEHNVTTGTHIVDCPGFPARCLFRDVLAIRVNQRGLREQEGYLLHGQRGKNTEEPAGWCHLEEWVVIKIYMCICWLCLNHRNETEEWLFSWTARTHPTIRWQKLSVVGPFNNGALAHLEAWGRAAQKNTCILIVFFDVENASRCYSRSRYELGNRCVIMIHFGCEIICCCCVIDMSQLQLNHWMIHLRNSYLPVQFLCILYV